MSAVPELSRLDPRGSVRRASGLVLVGNSYLGITFGLLVIRLQKRATFFCPMARQAIQIGDKRPRPCQCQKSFPCPAHQLARATISLPLVCSGTWVQSWVQLEVLFQPKTGVKLRQINESVDGS